MVAKLMPRMRLCRLSRTLAEEKESGKRGIVSFFVHAETTSHLNLVCVL